jgi:hypothetical protein
LKITDLNGLVAHPAAWNCRTIPADVLETDVLESDVLGTDLPGKDMGGPPYAVVPAATAPGFSRSYSHSLFGQAMTGPAFKNFSTR